MEYLLPAAAVWLATALFMMLYAVRHRPDPAPVWWAAGDIVGFLGILSLVLRPDMPLTMSVFLTNLFGAGHLALHHMGLRAACDRPRSWVGPAIVVLVTLANTSLVATVPDAIAPRVILASGASMILALLLVWEAWSINPAWDRAPLRVLGTTALVVAALHLARVLFNLAGLAHADPMTFAISHLLFVLTLAFMIMNLAFLWTLDQRRAHAQQADLRRLASELARSTQQAQGANRAKSAFLASMSHELRTPLNAIMGFSDALSAGIYGPLTPRQTETLGLVQKAGGQLSTLVNELLDLARIEAGQMDVHVEAVELAPLLAEVVAGMAPLAERARVAVVVAPCPGAAVSADAARLRQVMTNLISNAIKYNRPRGAVRVEVEGVEDHWRILVTDTGIGIAEDQLERLFKPFSRLVPDGSSIEGTGIGLSLARQLTELMGGGIGVSSEFGYGSRFWVDLPKAGMAAGRGAGSDTAAPPGHAPSGNRETAPAL